MIDSLPTKHFLLSFVCVITRIGYFQGALCTKQLTYAFSQQKFHLHNYRCGVIDQWKTVQLGVPATRRNIQKHYTRTETVHMF